MNKWINDEYMIKSKLQADFNFSSLSLGIFLVTSYGTVGTPNSIYHSSWLAGTVQILYITNSTNALKIMTD